MKKALKKIISFILRPYFYFYGSWPVWFFVLNRSARLLYKKDKRHPTETEKKLSADLKENGIASVHIDELFPGKNLFPVLRDYANTLLPASRARPGKPFLKALWEDDHPLDLSNPFMRLALSDEALAVVNGYADMYSKFFYSSLDLTMPVGEGSSPVRSQNWHRDPEDRKMCKIFLYLTDVDESSGPFTYIRSSHRDGLRGSYFPQRPPKGSYPPAKDVENNISSEAIQVCTGRAGTIIFADTAGLHRGGYATQNSRLMFTAEYSSRASLRPIRYRYPKNFESMRQFLSPSAGYAVNNNFGWVKLLRFPSDIATKYGIHE